VSEAIRPLGDKVLVRPDAPVEKTPGGVILPQKAQETPRRGVVLAVGDGEWHFDRLTPLFVKPGEVVYWPAFVGWEIEIGGEKLLLVRCGDLLGVVTGSGETGDKSGG